MKITDAILVSIDTETTHPDPAEARICQVGVVTYHRHLSNTSWCALVNPGTPIPKGASEVNGIYDGIVADAPDFVSIAGILYSFVDPQIVRNRHRVGVDVPVVLTGYNFIDYDALVLDAEFARHVPTGAPAWPYIIDPLIWLRWYQRGLRSRKLGEMCKHYRVESGLAHTADADARAALQLLLTLIDEGIIPDDVERACTLQDQMLVLLDAERERFGNTLYGTRVTKPDGSPGIRLSTLWCGFGQHCGNLLAAVPADFWDWLSKSNNPAFPPPTAATITAVVKSLRARALAVPAAWAEVPA